MKILMLGWEFPPNSVGGLGTHTYEIVKALSLAGVKIKLILPYQAHLKVHGVEFYSTDIDTSLSVYYNTKEGSSAKKYGNVYSEMMAYTNAAVKIASGEDFDIIHANDWLTALAGIRIKEASGKPLLMTMHSTESDRTAGHPWEFIADFEKDAVNKADSIVAVSNRLKEELVSQYGADPSKISVIHNAIDTSKFNGKKVNRGSKVVLYVGRLSVQKGIDHLIHAFKIVADQDPDAFLYIVGEGPQMHDLIHLTIQLGISNRVIFFGHVPDDVLEDFYAIANVFVMPSVSEPFGITALESIASKTPTIISVQSGVSEVVNNVFKVDFWDSNQMADIILGLLGYPAVKEAIASEAYNELKNLTWENSASKFMDVYGRMLRRK